MSGYGAIAAPDAQADSARSSVDSRGIPHPVKHGMANTPEHIAWRHMKDRCLNQKSQRYDRYGARGITVCDRWLNSFENFYADMGPRPSPEHSIDRIDNNGNYEPSNVRWATRAQQNANKSDCVYLEHDGRRMTIIDWSRETGLNARTIALRVKAGWLVAAALTVPAERRVWDGEHSTKSRRILAGMSRDLASACVMNESDAQAAQNLWRLRRHGTDVGAAVAATMEILSRIERRSAELLRRAENEGDPKWMNAYVRQSLSKARRAETIAANQLVPAAVPSGLPAGFVDTDFDGMS